MRQYLRQYRVLVIGLFCGLVAGATLGLFFPERVELTLRAEISQAAPEPLVSAIEQTVFGFLERQPIRIQSYTMYKTAREMVLLISSGEEHELKAVIEKLKSAVVVKHGEDFKSSSQAFLSYRSLGDQVLSDIDRLVGVISAKYPNGNYPLEAEMQLLELRANRLEIADRLVRSMPVGRVDGPLFQVTIEKENHRKLISAFILLGSCLGLMLGLLLLAFKTIRL